MNSPTQQVVLSAVTSPKKSYSVVIADDHEIFRKGLNLLLSRYPFLKLLGEVSNGKELKELVTRKQPDLIFLDLNMPIENGFSAASEILKKYPRTKIIVLSFYDDAVSIGRMMKMGVSAYLTKNMTQGQLDDVLQKVLNNHRYISPDAATNVALQKIMPDEKAEGNIKEWLMDELTVREKQVLQMIVNGQTQRQIALVLNISPRTVETHKTKLMRKMGAKNSAEMIALAHQCKLV